MKRWFRLALATGLLLEGCSTSHAASSSAPETAAQVAGRVAGLTCSPADWSQIAIHDIKPLAELDCTLDGQSVTIGQFSNAGQINASLAEGKKACPFLKARGVTSVNVVIGKYWAATSQSKAAALRVQAAEGGGSTFVTFC